MVTSAARGGGRTPGEERPGSSSDHARFARAGIPVGGVFAGLDRCHHRACDGPGTVEVALVRAVTTALTDAAATLSDGP